MGMMRTERLLLLLRWPLWRTLGLELLIVFAGMAGAFFVNDLQQERAKQKAVREALVAIHADLRQYARNGLDPEVGFVLLMRKLDERFKAGLAQRSLAGRPSWSSATTTSWSCCTTCWTPASSVTSTCRAIGGWRALPSSTVTSCATLSA